MKKTNYASNVCCGCYGKKTDKGLTLTKDHENGLGVKIVATYRFCTKKCQKTALSNGLLQSFLTANSYI